MTTAQLLLKSLCPFIHDSFLCFATYVCSYPCFIFRLLQCWRRRRKVLTRVFPPCLIWARKIYFKISILYWFFLLSQLMYFQIACPLRKIKGSIHIHPLHPFDKNLHHRWYTFLKSQGGVSRKKVKSHSIQGCEEIDNHGRFMWLLSKLIMYGWGGRIHPHEKKQNYL